MSNYTPPWSPTTRAEIITDAIESLMRAPVFRPLPPRVLCPDGEPRTLDEVHDLARALDALDAFLRWGVS